MPPPLPLPPQAKREEVQRIQEMVERIQRDAVERIDDLSDRTFTLREESLNPNPNPNPNPKP